MSFDIVIKVDPGDSATKIKGVTDGLTQAEAKGKAAGEAMLGLSGAFKSLAQAMQQEQSALQRTSQLHDQLAVKNSGLVGSFGGVAAAIQREQDMLEKINGPARQYMEDLQTLDALLAKNQISTQQYTEQITQMNQALEQTPKQGGSSGSGNLQTLLYGGVVGGSIAAVMQTGRQIDDLLKGYEQLDDQYSNLFNHALKFTDAGRDVNTVLAEQDQLAGELHGSMKDTADVYDAVQDATVDLNQSHRDLVTLTKVLGEEAVISGKSMSSAGDVLNRMTLAMDSGVNAGKALKQALVGYDAISDTLTAHFGTTRAGLVELVNQHKIGSQEIIDALKAEADQVQQNFDKRRVTNDQERALAADRFALYRQDTDSQTAMFEAADPQLRKLDLDIRSWTGTLNDAGKATHFVTDEVRQFGVQLDQLKDKQAQTVRDGMAGFVSGLVQVAQGATSTVTNIDDLAKHLGIVDPWAVATDAAKKYEDRLASVRHTLDALIDAANHIPSKSAGMNGEEATATGEGAFIAGIGPSLTTQQKAVETYRQEMGQLIAMWQDAGLSIDQVNQRLAQMNVEYQKNLGAADETKQRQHDLQTMLDAIKKPQEDYARDMDLVNQLYRDGAIGAQEYADKVAAIKAAYDATQKHSTDFVTGLARGWDDIKKSTTDTAHTIESAFKSAFDNMNSTLADFFTKGTADWSKFASSIESDLVKLALQTAEGSIISSLAPTPHFATGGSGYVGGSGGTDSQLFVARVTPGEHYEFTPPGQAEDARKGGSSSGGGHTTNIIAKLYDRTAIISNRDDDQRVLASIRRNIGAVKTHLGL